MILLSLRSEIQKTKLWKYNAYMWSQLCVFFENHYSGTVGLISLTCLTCNLKL